TPLFIVALDLRLDFEARLHVLQQLVDGELSQRRDLLTKALPQPVLRRFAKQLTKRRSRDGLGLRVHDLGHLELQKACVPAWATLAWPAAITGALTFTSPIVATAISRSAMIASAVALVVHRIPSLACRNSRLSHGLASTIRGYSGCRYARLAEWFSCLGSFVRAGASSSRGSCEPAYGRFVAARGAPVAVAPIRPSRPP